MTEALSHPKKNAELEQATKSKHFGLKIYFPYKCQICIVYTC
jgi:hypothetical protein